MMRKYAAIGWLLFGVVMYVIGGWAGHKDGERTERERAVRYGSPVRFEYLYPPQAQPLAVEWTCKTYSGDPRPLTFFAVFPDHIQRGKTEGLEMRQDGKGQLWLRDMRGEIKELTKELQEP